MRGYAEVTDRALARARGDGSAPRKVLAVLGANWCHDSRALAGWLLDARHSAALDRDFVVAFVDFGKPQDGHGHNLDLAARFGIAGLNSTPALMVLDAEGHRLNSPPNICYASAIFSAKRPFPARPKCEPCGPNRRGSR
jgi:hypothetical protein